MRPTRHFNPGISLFVALALCGAAMAEEVEEYIIETKKRELNVQDVPISVTIFSDDFFTRSDVHTLRDLARHTPNLSLPRGSTLANQLLVMRGVGSVGNSTIEPTVAVFIDGVYYPRASSVVGSMTDLERAEVLRGPQGTLFGRNASMGALNIVTKGPTKENAGRISYGYGDYDEKRVSGYVNGAFSEKAFARLSFQASDRDGYGENSYTQDDNPSTVGDWSDLTVRGKLLLTPNATTDVLLTADYSRLMNDGNVVEFIGDTVTDEALNRLAGYLPSGELPETEDPYDYRIHQSHRDDADDTQWGLRGDITWTVGGHTIQSITAYRDWENDTLNQSILRLPADLVPADQLYDAETLSQELRITSPEGGDVGYVFGLYYYDEEYSLDSRSYIGKDFCRVVERLITDQLKVDDFAGAREIYFAEAYEMLVGDAYDSATTSAIDAAVAAVPAAAQAMLRASLEDEVKNEDFREELVRQTMTKGSEIDATETTVADAKEYLTGRLQPAFAALGPGAEPVASGIINALVDGAVQIRTVTEALSEGDNPMTLAELPRIAALAGQAAAGQCVIGGTNMATTDFDQDVKNYAAYGRLTFDLTPQWRLTTGMRYTKSEKDGKFVSITQNPLVGPATQENPLGLDLRLAENHPNLTQDEEKVTWLASLSHFLDQDTMVFANFSTGYKSGGFNPEAFNRRAVESERTRNFGAETTKNYELGVKSTLMEGRLVANATLYRTEINDYQQRHFDGVNNTVLNTGDLTQQGVELDVRFQPRQEFYATLGVSYLDSEFDSFPNATAFPGELARVAQINQGKERAICLGLVALGARAASECLPLEPTPTRDLKGERNHFSPKWQVALSTEWTDSLPDIAMDWFVRGEYQYMDDQNVGGDTNQNPDTMQSSYNLFNGGAGLRGQNGDWEVSLFVKNISDEEYCQSKYSQPLASPLLLADPATGRGAQRCALGEPRTWSLTGSFLF